VEVSRGYSYIVEMHEDMHYHLIGANRYRPVYKDRRCDLEVVLRANSVRLASTTSYTGHGPVQEEFRHAVGTFWKVNHILKLQNLSYSFLVVVLMSKIGPIPMADRATSRTPWRVAM